MSKTKIKLYLNILLFLSFVIVNMPQATGITLHEWLGFVFIPVIMAHVVLEWQWVLNTTKRFLSRLKGQVRVNYVLNVLLFVAMVAVIFSGILISEAALPALGIAVTPDSYWIRLHELSANLLMLMIGVHLAMHWKWIVSSSQRYLFRRSERKIVAVTEVK